MVEGVRGESVRKQNAELRKRMGPGKYCGHDQGALFKKEAKKDAQPFNVGAPRFAKNPDRALGQNMSSELVEKMGPGRYVSHDNGALFKKEAKKDAQPFNAGVPRFAKNPDRALGQNMSPELVEKMGPGRYISHDHGALFRKEAKKDAHPFNVGSARFEPPDRRTPVEPDCDRPLSVRRQNAELKKSMGPGKYLSHSTGALFKKEAKTDSQPFNVGVPRFSKNPDRALGQNMSSDLVEKMGPGRYVGHEQGALFKKEAKPDSQPFNVGAPRFSKNPDRALGQNMSPDLVENMGPGRYVGHEQGALFKKEAKKVAQPFNVGSDRFPEE